MRQPGWFVGVPEATQDVCTRFSLEAQGANKQSTFLAKGLGAPKIVGLTLGWLRKLRQCTHRSQTLLFTWTGANSTNNALGWDLLAHIRNGGVHRQTRHISALI